MEGLEYSLEWYKPVVTLLVGVSVFRGADVCAGGCVT